MSGRNRAESQAGASGRLQGNPQNAGAGREAGMDGASPSCCSTSSWQGISQWPAPCLTGPRHRQPRSGGGSLDPLLHPTLETLQMQNRKGFTLIELLIVVVIIGILAA